MFVLSARSLARMEGVHPHLVEVMKLAIQKSPVDFGVIEGVRSIEKQRHYVNTGASQTMDSRHLKSPVDQFGHAIDIMPYLDTDGDGDKEYSPHWAHYWAMAAAVRDAAIILKVPVRWGGCWDRSLNSLKDPQEACAAYVARRRAMGKKKVFIDGPHFELPKGQFYP